MNKQYRTLVSQVCLTFVDWLKRADTKYPERNMTEKSPKELIKVEQNAIYARSQRIKPAENANPESQILNPHQLFFVFVVHL